MWKLRRQIGAAIRAKANAMLLMDRVAHTGVDVARGFIRGSPGRSLGSFGGGEAAEASYAHRQQRNAAPRWEAP